MPTKPVYSIHMPGSNDSCEEYILDAENPGQLITGIVPLLLCGKNQTLFCLFKYLVIYLNNNGTILYLATCPVFRN